jgi:hypothetical protein
MILAAVEVEVEEYPKSNTMHKTAAAMRWWSVQGAGQAIVA